MSFNKETIKQATAKAKETFAANVKGSFKARKVADILMNADTSADTALLSKLLGAVLEEKVDLNPTYTDVPANVAVRSVHNPEEIYIIVDGKYAYDVKSKSNVKHWLKIEHITGVANDGKKSRVFLTDDQIDNLKLS